VIIGATLLVLGPDDRDRFRAERRAAAALRLISGLGLGCIIPNATALVGEFSPKRSRVTLTMGITVGFTAGAAIGGFVALWLIPLFGWRSVFFVGGAVPLVIAVAMYLQPARVAAVPGRAADAARPAGALAEEARPLDQVGPSTEYVANEKARTGVRSMHLFSEGAAPSRCCSGSCTS
jgi:AAHS family 4-hydroxybenzoate transporter-like MFS transporter